MKNTTDITMVLDRLGSMQSIAQETIDGFNAFLKEQKSLKGRANLTLAQFDHEYELLYQGVDLKEAIPLSHSNYIPRGLTSLLDAIGKTIEITKHRLKKEKLIETAHKVIFVIITDGHENNSNKFTRSQIFKKIKKLETSNDWQFVFLGANQDAIEEAGHIGIPKSRAMTFRADGEGVVMFMRSVSTNLNKVRENDAPFIFTDAQREEQLDQN